MDPQKIHPDSGFSMTLVVLSNALPASLYYPGMEGHAFDKQPTSDETPKDA